MFARYDLEGVKNGFSKGSLNGRVKGLWRYGELLPVVDDRSIVSLGEGFTPIVSLKNGGGRLLLKDDGLLPTGTFKARGMCVAVSRAKELGVRRFAVPSAGNAAGALACYVARGGLEAVVYMPVDTPLSMRRECEAFGASVRLVEGSISDAGRVMRSELAGKGFFDVSTLREPYRVEGKKTMGLEIAEQLGFELPDVIVYPTGGGTGVVGMWKAFGELEELGWIGSRRPRMVSVQAEGCAPIVKAFMEGREKVDEPYPNPSTVASGLRVPQPYASEQILKVLRESGGAAVTVSDREMLDAMCTLAAKEGVFACPEGAATYSAYRKMIDDGFVKRDETVLLYNTGTGLKYLDIYNKTRTKAVV